MDDADLQQKAKDHLWMHFSRQSVLEEHGAPIIVKGQGHHIWDSKGRKYFDGLSGLFVAKFLKIQRVVSKANAEKKARS